MQGGSLLVCMVFAIHRNCKRRIPGTMRIALPISLLIVLQLVNGFTILQSRQKLSANTLTNWKTLTSLSSTTETDDYDDWYADFDPSEYEDSNAGSNRMVDSSRDHDYTRDMEADDSNVNHDIVNDLIAERLEHRKRGRYDQADAIRDVLLKEHGVAIFDREKVWRSGCSTGGSGKKWRPNQTSGKPSGGKERNFGPNGHDYELSSTAGPKISSLEESEIHELLAERLQCKLNRDFRKADAIQQQLEQEGVFVHDGNKEWRADGESFDNYRNKRGVGRNRPYEQSPQSLATDDVNIIQDLVNQRMEARLAGDYQTADDIKVELDQDYNVRVNDRLRQWSVGGGWSVARQQKYSMSPVSTTPSNAELVQQLVEERNEARKIRDYDKADAIRDELLEQNIMIDDSLKQWAVGGKFRNDNEKSSLRGLDTPFVKRGYGGDLDEDQEAMIMELLQERNEAKRDKNFGKADRIRDRLQDEFKVRIDDRAREWHVVSDKYNMNPVFDIDSDIRALIEERIVERSVAKLEKDYLTADSIRDELREVYGVVLDDRVREWQVIGSPMRSGDGGGFVDAESDFDVDDDADNEYGQEPSEADDASGSATNDVVESMDSEDLESLTIPQLKIRLKEAGLPVSGKKAELIERLCG